ncbi:MAG: amino acid synthesis family protein [Actinomycetota bacterium]|nr:amino acid synthesis family protein [Actinomycetota bacterium]
MEGRIRKVVTMTEEVLVEGDKEVATPWKLAGAAVIIENPFAGEYVEDLNPLLDHYCADLGPLLGGLVADLLDNKVEAFGKAGIAGLNGEVEHVAGILHNLVFGNPVRQALGATSLLPSTEKRAAAGATIDVPLKHVHDHTVRSHHQTYEMRVPDGPGPDELLIAIAAASTGRPHSRLGEFASEAPADISEA